MAAARLNAKQKLAAVAKFWSDRAFRASILKEAKKRGITPKAINPDNLKMILEFLAALLPLIFEMFKPKAV